MIRCLEIEDIRLNKGCNSSYFMDMAGESVLMITVNGGEAHLGVVLKCLAPIASTNDSFVYCL